MKYYRPQYTRAALPPGEYTRTIFGHEKIRIMRQIVKYKKRIYKNLRKITVIANFNDKKMIMPKFMWEFNFTTELIKFFS